MIDKNNTQQHQRRPGLTLGECLTQAREQAGLSRRQLERLSGVGRMNITRLETDWYHQPPADDLVRLARALELNDTDLFLLAGLPVPAQGASLRPPEVAERRPVDQAVCVTSGSRNR